MNTLKSGKKYEEIIELENFYKISIEYFQNKLKLLLIEKDDFINKRAKELNL
jgi:hypothetical protein